MLKSKQISSLLFKKIILINIYLIYKWIKLINTNNKHNN